MYVIVTTKWSRTPGPKTKINCPKCEKVTPAKSFELEFIRGLFWIPMLTTRRNHIECLKCRKVLLCKLPFDEVDEYSADDLDPYLYQEGSFIVKFLAVSSVLLFWAPMVGAGLSLIAVIATIRSKGWTKWCSLVGFSLSLIVTTAFLVLMSYAKNAQELEAQKATPTFEAGQQRPRAVFTPFPPAANDTGIQRPQAISNPNPPVVNDALSAPTQDANATSAPTEQNSPRPQRGPFNGRRKFGPRGGN